MGPGQTMSKQLLASAARLEDIARNHTSAVKRVLREYSEIAQASGNTDITVLAKEREVDRVVGEYLAVHRELRRIRKKLMRSVQRAAG